MLRTLVAVAILSLVVSPIAGQDFNLRVRTVNLHGDPVPGIPVKIGDIERKSDSNGLATFENDEKLPPGSLMIKVNSKADFPRNRSLDYIGREKRISWDQPDQFASEFIIPLWRLGDVKSLGTAVVRNPEHYAVVLQYDKNDVGNTRVIAKSEGDALAWIEEWVPDLPAVTSPHLARSLYAALEPGATVPAQFADEMAEVYREVERINQAARICRQSPKLAIPRTTLYPPQEKPKTNRPKPTPTPPTPTPPIPIPPTPTPPTPTTPAPTTPAPTTPDPPVITYRPPATEFVERQVTTYKPAWETRFREQRTVVRRPVIETVMQNQNCTIYEPVTTMRTEYCDQGSYVDRVVPTPSVARNRLQWLPGTYAVNPVTGTTSRYRGGLHWVPQQTPATYQVQRHYVPTIVARQVPTTTYVAKVVVRQTPVQVTRYVDEVVTTKVPVQVRKMIAVTETIRVPRTATDSSYHQAPSGQGVLDDGGWTGVNGQQ